MANYFNFHKFRGTDDLSEIIDRMNENILVYFDPDVDGMISGLLVCKFLRKFKHKHMKCYVNENRGHGWGLPVKSLKGYDCIAVDFRIEKEEIKEIVDSGVNIISMDHHVNGNEYIEYKNNGHLGRIINNQYPFEPQDGAYLSGAGVVFETLRNLEPAFDTQENRALVGITLLSDVMPIENRAARSYLTTLYNYPYKGYIKYLIDAVYPQASNGRDRFGFGVPKMDRDFVDYTFSPKINAMLRFNRGTEVMKFFLQQGSLDLTCRDRQKEVLGCLSANAKVRHFSNLTVVFFYYDDIASSGVLYKNELDLLPNFVGLLASQYLDYEKSVICYEIGVENGVKKVLRASFRGASAGIDYLAGVSKFCNGVGHQAAFGIKELVPNKEMFENINETCKKLEMGDHPRPEVKTVSNFSVYVKRFGKAVADNNGYVLSQDRTYIKYTGHNWEEKKNTGKMIIYLVDGIEVKCFDMDLTPETGYVIPSMNRGYAEYKLVRGF